ncbi:hypothetical protein KR009_011909 [Drosophila setifemur]|nr:hypothetical protein KR009_011909 [Drosophila setifemur]
MIVSLIFRVGLVAGTVYATQKMGIWGSPEHSQDLMALANKELGPYADDLKQKFCCWRYENCTGEEMETPWKESMVDAWNDTIKKTFNVLGVKLPFYCNRFTDDLARGIDDVVNDTEEW